MQWWKIALVSIRLDLHNLLEDAGRQTHKVEGRSREIRILIVNWGNNGIPHIGVLSAEH